MKKLESGLVIEACASGQKSGFVTCVCACAFVRLSAAHQQHSKPRFSTHTHKHNRSERSYHARELAEAAAALVVWGPPCLVLLGLASAAVAEAAAPEAAAAVPHEAVEATEVVEPLLWWQQQQ
jgi:hypothetical protein